MTSMTGIVPTSSIMEEHPMHAVRMMSAATLAFGLLATAVAPAVHAQGSRTDQAASMIYIGTDGRIMQMPVDAADRAGDDHGVRRQGLSHQRREDVGREDALRYLREPYQRARRP